MPVRQNEMDVGSLKGGPWIAGLSRLRHTGQKSDAESAGMRSRATFDWLAFVLTKVVSLVRRVTPQSFADLHPEMTQLSMT
ncbi:hypothetical protein Mal65_26730 [Crateriforma conspicua]|nr:hypothetical protein Mal65_26730 [Crateriforma conspicua]